MANNALRKGYTGDVALAKSYTGEALAQLGILKNLMAFGKLQQLSRRVQLSDGTTIVVSSVFGQDTIRIDAPMSASSGAAVTTKRTRKIYELVVVGQQASSGGSVASFIWTKAKGFRLLVPSAQLANTMNAVQSLVGGVLYPSLENPVVSADGNTVVGSFSASNQYLNYPLLVGPFLWTEKTGVTLPLGPSDGGGVPTVTGTGVSKDGSVVVGLCEPGDGTLVVYRWSASTGVVVIPVQIPGTINALDASPRLSSDGGTVVITTASFLSIVLWRASGMQTLPTLPGTYSYIATGVSKGGAVVVGFAFVPPSPLIPGDQFPAISGMIAWRWTAATGIVDLGLPNAQAMGVSDDGSIVTGNMNVYQPYVSQIAAASPPYQSAFVWTEAKGAVLQATTTVGISLLATAAAIVSAPDVGYVAVGNTNTPNQASATPCYWANSQSQNYFTNYGGVATSAALAETEIPA